MHDKVERMQDGCGGCIHTEMPRGARHGWPFLSVSLGIQGTLVHTSNDGTKVISREDIILVLRAR